MIKIKKIFILMMVMLLSISSFASIISNNDGAAFVTKDEFERMKSDFASQVEQYNVSIDEKTDGAIASYLAGIKTDKVVAERFPVGGGERVVICTSNLTNNLKFAKADIDFTFSLMCPQNAMPGSSQNQGFGIISLRREGEEAYELFCLDKTGKKFDYYDDKAKLILAGNWSFLNPYGFSGATSVSGFALRWHASPWKKAIKDRKNSNTVTSNQQYYYDDRFDHIGYVWLYATNCNWGNAHGDEAQMHIKKAISSVNIKNKNKTPFIFDNASAKSKIWVWDPTINKDRVCASEKGMYKTENQKYTLPDQAGITTSGQIAMYLQYYNSDTTTWKNNLKILTNFGWTDNGQFHTSSGTDTADDWYEFHLAPGENDEDHTDKDYNEPKDIVNSNFTNELLNEYRPYGFNGKITEGLPIGIFKNEGTISFEIDTTGISDDLILAIKTTPFTPYTETIDDIKTIDGISNVKINGTKVENCANKISEGKNKIEFEYNFDTKTAIYYKLAWPKDAAANVKAGRAVITLPKTYDLTQG